MLFLSEADGPVGPPGELEPPAAAVPVPVDCEPLGAGVVVLEGDFGVVDALDDASRLHASKSSCLGEPWPIEAPAVASTLAAAIVAIKVFM
jgi:hypothetical protein